MRQVINSGDMLSAIEAGESAYVDEGVMVLKESKWMMKTISADKVILAAVLVPEDAVDEYEKGAEDYVGLQFDHFYNFIESKTSSLEIQVDGREMHLYEGDDHVRLATIDPEAVSSGIPSAPDLTYEVKATGDISSMMSFFNKIKNYNEDASVMISPRDEGMYMYADGDNWMLDRMVEWDSFDDYNIDWEANKGNENPHGINPPEDEGVDVIQGVQNLLDITKPDNEATIYIANHMPTKLLFELDSGIKISYIISPRLSDDDERMTLPDRVIE